MKKYLLIYIVLTFSLISDSFSQSYTFNRISTRAKMPGKAGGLISEAQAEV